MLEKFRFEQQLAARLNTNWDEFRKRPRKEVEEYLVIIQLICREEQMNLEQRQKAQGGR